MQFAQKFLNINALDKIIFIAGDFQSKVEGFYYRNNLLY